MNRQNNPAGLTALGVTVLVWAASALGVAIPQEVAAAIVGLAAGLVSYLSTR